MWFGILAAVAAFVMLTVPALFRLGTVKLRGWPWASELTWAGYLFIVSSVLFLAVGFWGVRDEVIKANQARQDVSRILEQITKEGRRLREQDFVFTLRYVIPIDAYSESIANPAPRPFYLSFGDQGGIIFELAPVGRVVSLGAGRGGHLGYRLKLYSRVLRIERFESYRYEENWSGLVVSMPMGEGYYKYNELEPSWLREAEFYLAGRLYEGVIEKEGITFHITEEEVDR